MVSVASAQWGDFRGELPADHMDEVGQLAGQVVSVNPTEGHLMVMVLDRQAAVEAIDKGAAFLAQLADERGRFGPFGGRYVPETLVPAFERLEQGVKDHLHEPSFQEEFRRELREWVGRPTALTYAPRLSAAWGADVWLKREDLAHTGAHKINNAIGQALLAKRLGAERVIAETGAGQHGVATATVCAKFGLKCIVYMGAHDVQRQAPNVFRMRLLGAEVIPVTRASVITHALATPHAGRDGVVAGQGALVHLDGWTVEEMAIEPAVAMVVQWPEIRTRSFDFTTFSFRETPYSEAKEEAEEALQVANEQAEQILAEASAQAEQMTTEARQSAEAAVAEAGSMEVEIPPGSEHYAQAVLGRGRVSGWAGRYGEALRLGRDLYVGQACWHCHSQYVRPVSNEAERFGPVSTAQEYQNYLNQPHL